MPNGCVTKRRQDADIQQILLSEQQIAARVCELGEQISRDYAEKQLTLVGVLRGAVVFLSDLMRALSIPCQIDFLSASSYGSDTTSSGSVLIETPLRCDPRGKNLLVVEDILDTGITLSRLRSMLLEMGAASVRLAALLDKPERRQADVTLDYCGFSVPDAFLVGYGLDYAEDYRNLPYVGMINPDKIKK